MKDSNIENSDTAEISNKIEISKKELETVFDAISEMICIIDEDFRILRVNKRYADFLGKEIKDILGEYCYTIFWNNSEKCKDCPACETFITGGKLSKKQITRNNRDEVLYFDLKSVPVFDENKKVIHVIEFIHDETEEKRMIEQLIRSEKLASIGIMTAGIAHEMNNPLSGISGNAVNLLEMPEKYGLNDKGVSRVTTILESAARATAIMKDLLHLSRKNNSSTILVDLNKLLIKTVNAVHISGAGDVCKRYNFDETMPFVSCDPSKIEQVILNVVTNAIQSILEKKQKSKELRVEYSGHVLISTQYQDPDVQITISDNGMGIPEEIKSKIFDPFFSTRPPGQGTGLGLSICHRIIEEHQGKIFFESMDDLTVFSIVLPLDNGAAVHSKIKGK
jgi:PAS domain S-box-containing protein